MISNDKTGLLKSLLGSLPGTTAVAVQQTDGLNYALLMNKRDPNGHWHEDVKAVVDATLQP